MLLNVIVASDKLNYLHRWVDGKCSYSDIIASEVFAPCDCEIIYVGRDRDGYYSVIIQICADVVVQLSHLTTCRVEVGELVKSSQLLGIAKKFCRICLGTLSKHTCDDTIRIYSRMYYKRDPEQLTEENLGFVKFTHGDTGSYVNSLAENIKFSHEQDLEYQQMENQYVDE